MNRKSIASLVAGSLLVVSTTVWAAPTVEQNKKLAAAQAQMVEAQKEMVNAQADAGRITKEQAKRIIEQIDAQAARRKPLTNAQQKEIAAAYAKQVAARKALVKAQVEAGVISKEQGDAMIKQIEAVAAYQEKMGFENYRDEFQIYRGGSMNGPRMMGMMGAKGMFGPGAARGHIGMMGNWAGNGIMKRVIINKGAMMGGSENGAPVVDGTSVPTDAPDAPKVLMQQ